MISAVVCILGLTLLLSFLREIAPLAKIVERFPLVALFVPSWSFFAPLPGMLDYHIFYREVSSEEAKGEWKPTYQLSDRRPWHTCLWHPEKRMVKAVLDLVPDLLRLNHLSKGTHRIFLSLSYLHILNYISSLPRSESAKKVQFMLVSNSRLRDPEVLFVSEIHPVT